MGSGWNGPNTVDGVAFPHNHEGHSGWTIESTSKRNGISTLVATAIPQYMPHIVLLMIGTNEAIDNYEMANAPTRLGALIDSIYAKLPNILLVVGQPIPSRGDASQGDDTALSDRIKTFNDAIPAVIKTRADAGKHILLVDMYTPFNPNKPSLLADQWHPNLVGYVILGTEWYSALKSLLQGAIPRNFRALGWFGVTTFLFRDRFGDEHATEMVSISPPKLRLGYDEEGYHCVPVVRQEEMKCGNLYDDRRRHDQCQSNEAIRQE